MPSPSDNDTVVQAEQFANLKVGPIAQRPLSGLAANNLMWFDPTSGKLYICVDQDWVEVT